MILLKIRSGQQWGKICLAKKLENSSSPIITGVIGPEIVGIPGLLNVSDRTVAPDYLKLQ